MVEEKFPKQPSAVQTWSLPACCLGSGLVMAVVTGGYEVSSAEEAPANQPQLCACSSIPHRAMETWGVIEHNDCIFFKKSASVLPF